MPTKFELNESHESLADIIEFKLMYLVLPFVGNFMKLEFSTTVF